MNFTYTEEQLMFAETARTLLTDTCTPAHLREMMARGEARDDTRWNAIVETGLTLVLLPEAAGGLDLAEVDFAPIAEAAGYAGLPEPLVESAGVAAPLLAAIAPDHDVLTDPSATIAIQHPLNPFVADADTATVLILRHENETHVVAASAVSLTREESIDPFRRLFRVDWSPTAETRVEADQAGWDLALDRAALFAAAQGLGLAQRAIDLAVDYAKERTQFGKPIGSYQAVKHHLASAQVAVEFARPVVQAAAAAIGRQDDHARARVSHAKLVALEAADQAGRSSIQVHGAMGYSWEVDVHFFLKRAMALTYAWGDPAFHRARVAERLFRHPAGPDQLFAHEAA
ncbi:acyl-CoA dehydrogenase family protein [Novosphingobium aquimarinum]|uniref:acyl-CoA dehydrogenase family protein n=1 Tax=Novosphingobium aquimarinum TaxID=2682494 RepID=UPI0012EB2FA5|nr:acyl-CoA dehydrogenase family protein [Novosphingobium aquimarinum]